MGIGWQYCPEPIGAADALQMCMMAGREDDRFTLQEES
jgi:hypothetical protein